MSGPITQGETTYAAGLLASLRSGMILLADRNFGAGPLAAKIAATGAQFLIRVRTGASAPKLPALRRYPETTQALLHEILRRNGCRIIQVNFINGSGQEFVDPFFTTAHHVGSCRMADTPDDGVADANGEVFEHPGLYVSDGAAIPSSLAVNTSLTILANAERIAAGILERYGLRNPLLS